MIIEDKPERNPTSDWWGARVQQLLHEQKKFWPSLKKNYETLSFAKTKKIEIDDLVFIVQYDSARSKSSSAVPVEELIKSKKCLFCISSLPEEQNALTYNKNFVILCNQHPIFTEHFIIAKRKHVSQSIIGNFETLLDLARDLGKHFTLIYNGPKCGALTSEHMHFEAVTKNVIPLEVDFDNLIRKFSKLVLRKGKIEVRFFEEHLRYFISFESRDKGELLYTFKTFINAFRKVSSPHEESLINILSNYRENVWKLIFFPRWEYRPTQFFTERKDHLLIRSNALEMGGLFTVSRTTDFKKISKKEIAEIYRQITIPKEYFEFLRKKIGEIFT